MTMTRWLVLFVCAFAFAVAAPMGFKAEARKHKRQMCSVSMMDGKKVSWRCSASQKCCYSWFSGKGMCVGANDICL
jgi:hypothetical protein